MESGGQAGYSKAEPAASLGRDNYCVVRRLAQGLAFYRWPNENGCIWVFDRAENVSWAADAGRLQWLCPLKRASC